MGWVEMSKRELRRAVVLASVCAGRLTMTVAAGLMGITGRGSVAPYNISTLPKPETFQSGCNIVCRRKVKLPSLIDERQITPLPSIVQAGNLGWSDFSPSATISSISSARGLWSFRASSVGALSQTSYSSAVVRITGIALMNRSHHAIRF